MFSFFFGGGGGVLFFRMFFFVFFAFRCFAFYVLFLFPFFCFGAFWGHLFFCMCVCVSTPVPKGLDSPHAGACSICGPLHATKLRPQMGRDQGRLILYLQNSTLTPMVHPAAVRCFHGPSSCYSPSNFAPSATCSRRGFCSTPPQSRDKLFC